MWIAHRLLNIIWDLKRLVKVLLGCYMTMEVHRQIMVIIERIALIIFLLNLVMQKR